MKRDMDLVREILLFVEDKQHPGADPLQAPFTREGFDDATVAEHVRLLLEAGYLHGEIDTVMRSAGEPPWFMIEGITWEGHEYLDSIRNDTVWASVKSTAAEKGIGLTIDIVRALATAKIRVVLGLPPA